MGLRIIMVCGLLLCYVRGYSQDTTSTQLYWVVETNIHYRDNTIVRFYDQENVLVHEVKIIGVHIDARVPKKKRILDQLAKEFIERAISSSEKTQSDHSIHLNAKTLSIVMRQQF
jgi:hypothetical protein